MSEKSGLGVAAPLARLIDEEVLPPLGLVPDAFWRGVAAIFARFASENRTLLARRDALQHAIDRWHDERRDRAFDPAEYRAFLRATGYLVDEPAPFTIAPTKVDDAVARLAGPQLVVPALNARFLLNAVNARWGSLYDALYGTDATPGARTAGGYDPDRGALVIARAKTFLDDAVPLASGSHSDAAGYSIVGGVLRPTLKQPAALAGYAGDPSNPTSVLLKHNGLHIELMLDRRHPIGRTDPAGVADVVLESALTTIVDLEDSIAAIDADDKVAAYANWLGVMRGDLEAGFDKGGRAMTRKLNPDRSFTAPDGGALTLPGRSLLFVRNVGHLMTTPAVRLPNGAEAPEGILDAIVTSLIGLYDLKGLGRHRNSRAGWIYIVKPKMHGPEEAGFT
ncbi:MAG TPA: malate synthase G, partial [Rhizomicrobium sp.]